MIMQTKDIKSHGLTIENFIVLELLYNKGPQYIQDISENVNDSKRKYHVCSEQARKKGISETRNQ